MAFRTPARWLWVVGALALASCGGGGGGSAGDPAAGEALYNSPTIGRADAPGCITCHSLEPGVVKVGPSHAGVAGRAAETIAQSSYTGTATTVEGYLRESILEPNAYVEAGFAPGVMYQGYGETLTEGELADLIAFLATLR